MVEDDDHVGQETAVALANNFFGWGMVLRVTDPEGVRLAAE